MSGKIKFILLWVIGLACCLIAAVFCILYCAITPNIEILCSMGALFGGLGLGVITCTIVLVRHISGRKVKDEEWEEL